MNLLNLFLSIWTSIAMAHNYTFFMLDQPNAGLAGAVKLLLHYDEGIGATSFADSSRYGHTATSQSINFAAGSLTNPKFGSGDVLFVGTGGDAGAVTIPNTSDFNFGAGNFTVELWVNFNNKSRQGPLIGKRANSSTFAGWLLWNDGSNNVVLYMGSTGTNYDIATAAQCGTTSNFTWVSYAISRQGNKIYCYKNGVVGSTTTSTATVFANTDILVMGSDGNNANNQSTYMDEVRITKGIGLYGAAGYTPASAAFPNP